MNTDSFDFNNSQKFQQLRKSIFKIAIPIAIQGTVTSALGMLDSIMLGHLGNKNLATISVAAASQANRSFFVIVLLLFGISAGASIFFAQLYGKKDYQGIHKILGLVTVMSLLLSIIPVVWSLFCSESVMGYFINAENTQVLHLGARFIFFVGLSFPFLAVSMPFGFALRSVGNPNVPMIASVVALICNGVINYILIYGYGSIPMMGVEGSAIGTLLARIIEISIILGFLMIKKNHPLKMKIKQFFSFRWNDFMGYLKISLFVILEEGIWGTAMALQFSAIGSMGLVTAAAYSIISPFLELSLMLFVSIAQGVSIVIGNLIGSGVSQENIQWTAWKSIQITLMMSIFVSITFAVIPYYLLPIMFDVNENVLSLAKTTLIVFSICLLFRGVELVSSIGILRGGGDTLFTMIVNILGAWFIMLPIVYTTGYIFKLPLNYVLGLSFIYEFLVSIIVSFRIKSGKWSKDIPKLS